MFTRATTVWIALVQVFGTMSRVQVTSLLCATTYAKLNMRNALHMQLRRLVGNHHSKPSPFSASPPPIPPPAALLPKKPPAAPITTAMVAPDHLCQLLVGQFEGTNLLAAC